MSLPQIARVVWQGLSCTRITLPDGDSVVVSDFGAQVLSWQCGGQERLFLSQKAVLDGSAAIRGGVPVCFPQFNQRGPLPKHGLARRTTWCWHEAQSSQQDVLARWRWDVTEPLHAGFVYPFRAEVAVKVQPKSLNIVLSVKNTGDQAFAFTAALHTYLAVQDAQTAALQGLEGAAFWDAAQHFSPAVQSGHVVLGQEVDRVYARTCQSIALRDAVGEICINQDAAWPETVVWNPGPALTQQLPDMHPIDWQRMVCVEAAAINQPIALHPGQHWQAGQTLQVQR